MDAKAWCRLNGAKPSSRKRNTEGLENATVDPGGAWEVEMYQPRIAYFIVVNTHAGIDAKLRGARG